MRAAEARKIVAFPWGLFAFYTPREDISPRGAAASERFKQNGGEYNLHEKRMVYVALECVKLCCDSDDCAVQPFHKDFRLLTN